VSVLTVTVPIAEIMLLTLVIILVSYFMSTNFTRSDRVIFFRAMINQTTVLSIKD